MPNDVENKQPFVVKGFFQNYAGEPSSGEPVDYSKLSRYYPKGGVPGLIRTQRQVDNLLGWSQSNLARGLSFFPRTLGTAVAEFGRFFSRNLDAENFIKDISNNNPDYTNWATELLDDFEDWTKEKAPVYYRPDYDKKSAVDQMLSSEFWGDQAAQGTGFWVGNLLPMVLFKKVGVARIPALKRIPQVTGFPAKVYNSVSKALGRTPTGRYLSKEAINNAGIIGYSVLQTHSEAVAEASFLGKELRKAFEQKVKNGEITQEAADEQITLAMRSHYRYNLGVLGISNTIMNKMMFGTARTSSKLGRRLLSGTGKAEVAAADAASVQAGASATGKSTFVGNAASKIGKKLQNVYKGIDGYKINQRGKSITKGILVEGFWEEGSQTSGEMRIKRLALSGDLYEPSEMWLFRLPQLWADATETYGLDYSNMLSTKEGVHAITLGALLGSVGGVIESFSELKAEDKFVKAVKESRDKSLLIALGLLKSNQEIYEYNQDGTIATDDNNNPIWKKEFAVFNESQKQGFLALINEVQTILNSNDEKRINQYLKDRIIPQIISFYTSSEDLMEFLELELKNEGGDFLEMLKSQGGDPLLSAQEIMEVASELYATRVQTNAIENMFLTLREVQKDMKTEEGKATVQTFISEFIHSSYKRYEIEIMAYRKLLDSLDVSTPNYDDISKEIQTKIDELKKTQSLFLEASPSEWSKLYVAYVKGQEELNTVIRELAIKSDIGDAKTDQKDSNQEKIKPLTEEQIAVAQFMASATAALSDGNNRFQTKLFTTEYRFKDESGLNQTVVAVKNKNGDRVLLKNKTTGEIIYEYNPSSGIITNIKTGEEITSGLKVAIRAIKKRENAAKKQFKTAVDLALTVLKNNLSEGHINPDVAKRQIEALERLVKKSPFLDTESTVSILDLLDKADALADRSLEFIKEYQAALQEMLSSVGQQIINSDPEISAKFKVISESNDFNQVRDFVSELYNYVKGSKWKNVAPKFKTILDELNRLDKEYLNDQESVVKNLVRGITTQLIFDENFANLPDSVKLDNVLSLFSLENDDMIPVFSTIGQQVNVTQQQSPAITSPINIIRPAMDEKGMITNEQLTRGKNPTLNAYLRSQLSLIDFYRNSNEMLPAFLFTIRTFEDGKVRERFGEEVAEILASKVYFYYTDVDGQPQAITAREFMAMSAAEQLEIRDKISSDVKIIPMTASGKVSINGEIRALRKEDVNDDNVLVPHSSLLSKDRLLSYELDGEVIQRYRVLDLETGQIINDPTTQTEEQKQQMQQFEEAAMQMYDSVVENSQNEIIRLEFDKSTSGAMNTSAFIKFSSTPSALSAFLKVLKIDNLSSLFRQGQLVIPFSKNKNSKVTTLQIGGMTFSNVYVGIPYILVQKRLLPISPNKLSAADADEIVSLIDGYMRTDTDISEVTFSQLRNYIRSITHINSMTAAADDQTGYTWSFDLLPNNNVIVQINGTEYNLSTMELNEYNDFLKLLKSFLQSKFYNIMLAKDGKLADANVYDTIVFKDKKFTRKARSREQYLNSLESKFSIFYNHKILNTQPLVWNSGAQYTVPSNLRPVKSKVDSDIIDRGNLPTLEEWNAYSSMNADQIQNIAFEVMNRIVEDFLIEPMTWVDFKQILSEIEDITVNITNRESFTIKNLIESKELTFYNLFSSELSDEDIIEAFFEELRKSFEEYKPLGKNDC